MQHPGIGDTQIVQASDAVKTFRGATGDADRPASRDAAAEWRHDVSTCKQSSAVQLPPGIVADTLKSLRDALANAIHLAKSDPGNAEYQRDLSVSYHKMGEALIDQGNLPEALKNFREDLAIAEHLARSEPGNAHRQRDLAVSYSKIGGVQVEQGNLADALKCFGDALALFDNLVKSDPGSAERRRDLALCEAAIELSEAQVFAYPE